MSDDLSEEELAWERYQRNQQQEAANSITNAAMQQTADYKAQRDTLVKALTLFLATDETMEGILWGKEPDTALVKITIPLGQYREARAVLRAVVGGR